MNFSWMVLDSNADRRCSNVWSCFRLFVYISNYLKWNAPFASPRGVISKRYRYPTLDELKCPILILQGFKV